jgi:hypothetical protein
MILLAVIDFLNGLPFMKIIINVLTLLCVPIAILNLLGGIISAIWLAVLGDWRIIGIGIGLVILSGSILRIVLMPAILLMAPTPYFARKGSMLLVRAFTFLGSLYITTVFALWCAGVLLFFVKMTTDKSIIPVLIWSYVVAIGPLVILTNKEVQAGGGESSIIFTVFTQFGYAATILVVVLTGVFSLIPLILGIFIALIINFIAVTQLREADFSNGHQGYSFGR